GTLTATATLVVQAPQLVLTKVANTPVNATDPIAYTITVSNTGTGLAYGVNLSDPLPTPTGVTWLGITTNGPAGTPQATFTSTALSDNLGTLAAGATVTIVLTGTTTPGFSGTLTNTATVTSTNNAPDTLT